jgi:exopolysaccharide biosynthesis polyprenyl glycosylphosphotransferase
MLNKSESHALPLTLRGERQIAISFPLKKGLLFLGDLLLLNLALFLALTLRHFELPDPGALPRHFVTFNILYGSWLLAFYSVGLYDIEFLSIPGSLGRKLVQGMGLSGIVTIVLFYSLSFLKFQPKTILVLDLTLSAAFLFVSRIFFMYWGRNGHSMKILLCGKATEVNQLQELSRQNGHLGFEISEPLVLCNGEDGSPAARIIDRLRKDPMDILAITRSLTEDATVCGLSYQLLCSGIHVIEVSHLSEELTGKIPVSAINEGWFVENLREFNKRGFDIFKRFLDVTAAVVLGVPTVLLFPLVALTIKLDSSGPILFRQKRMGKGGRLFDVVKFRTMIQDAEREGAQWAVEGDTRVTAVGGLLRKTRIDELPQLWNVLKGEMSLVGPRPERPEFVEELLEKIPFYETRHLVKPGLTGWAQINFRYGASADDAMEKLQYELYYIKNRSVLLELSILIKTLATVLRYEGR